jgi:hypothetical protein
MYYTSYKIRLSVASLALHNAHSECLWSGNQCNRILESTETVRDYPLDVPLLVGFSTHFLCQP